MTGLSSQFDHLDETPLNTETVYHQLHSIHCLKIGEMCIVEKNQEIGGEVFHPDNTATIMYSRYICLEIAASF